MDNFGIKNIDNNIKNKLEKIGKIPLHHMIRRNLIYAHRDLDKFIEHYEQNKQVYIYTGRGVSGNMHLGHIIPFDLTVYLQQIFNCIVIIQLSVDEKYLFRKDLELEDLNKYLDENIKDIISRGFNPSKTFIFNNIDYLGTNNVYKYLIQLEKLITYNSTKSTYGFNGSENIGMINWVAKQIMPCFPIYFPQLLSQDAMCLVPYSIDQDPYFRDARYYAEKLGYQKPTSIIGSFLKSLDGTDKMSTNSVNPIYLNDDAKVMEKKIKQCVSGGRDTLEEHRRLGAILDKDVAYNYLLFFEEDDTTLDDITEKYSKGIMTTKEVKTYLINKLNIFLNNHKENRNKIDKDLLKKFVYQIN